MRFKIGLGTDIHQLAVNRELWLGGIKIEHNKGLLGHSDADVVIHSIADAIIGALGLGDIGEWFSDTDIKNKNLPGKDLLATVVKEMNVKGATINNLDIVIHAEAPKLVSHKMAMKGVLSRLLGIEESQINIKAKTNEKLDSIGQCLAISCTSVVLLQVPK